MVKVFLAIWCAILGCSALAGECTDKHSKGYCLLDMAGMTYGGVSDVSAEKAKELLDKAGVPMPEKGFDSIQAGFAAASFAHVGAPPLPGFGFGGTGALLLLRAFSGSGKVAPRLFFMLKESEVKNDDPYATMEDILKGVVLKFLDGDAMEVIDVENPSMFGKSILRSYKVTGGKCGQNGCDVNFPAYNYPNAFKDLARVEEAPEWLNEKGKLYIWKKYFWAEITGMAGKSSKYYLNSSSPDLQEYFQKHFYYFKPGGISVVYNSEASYPLVK